MHIDHIGYLVQDIERAIKDFIDEGYEIHSYHGACYCTNGPLGWKETCLSDEERYWDR